MSDYRIRVVSEHALTRARRSALAVLLGEILDDGWAYAGEGWRVARPELRAIALHGDAVVGQASGFAVPSHPAVGVFGLGDVAVSVAHRRRGLARALCRAVTEAAWRRGAGVALAKTVPLRGVLAELGYEPVTDFSYWYLEHGLCVRHPDWMAAAPRRPARRVRLAVGDF